jgi:Tfp pilus assembly protein PilN
VIKVNLLKNKASGTRTGVSTVDEPQFDEVFDETGARPRPGDGLFSKVGLILMWTICLYAYEWYNIGRLNSELAGLTSEATQLDVEIAKLKPQVEKSKVLQKENDELNSKVTLVKNMGRLRLREIRAIDHLQNIVPEKVWFNSFKFTEENFEVTGLSANDQELDVLLDGIRQNPTFQDVILSRSIEQKTAQGNVKSFLITSKLARGP